MKKKIEKLDLIFIRHLRRIPIFSRLFLLFSLCSIIPLLFITFYNFQKNVDELSANTQQYLSLITSNLLNQIDTTLIDYEDLSRAFYANEENIRILTENNTIAQNDENYMQNELYQQNKVTIAENFFTLASTDYDIINITFISPYDQYNMKPNSLDMYGAIIHDLDSFYTSPYYLDAIEKKGYSTWYDASTEADLIYKFPYSQSGIQNTFAMTVSVYNHAQDEFLGVLMLNIDIDSISNNYTNYSFYNSGNTLLLTEQDVLAVFNSHIDAPNIDDVTNYTDDIFQNSSGAFTIKDKETNIFVSYEKSSKLAIYVVHMVDLDKLLTPAYESRTQSLILVAILLVLCIIIARISSLSIAIPLTDLIGTMNLFSKDFSKVRYPHEGKDEITIVGDHYNIMAEETEQLMTDIVNSHIREKDLEINQVTAQLNALQMQINPHFMYNTLDIIRWSSIHIGNGENDTSRMIDAFCKLMRMSIKKDESFITVSNELAHITAYLDVVNFSKTNKIKIVNTLEFNPDFHRIPKLTLQPLVENSVLHGFDKSNPNPIIHINGWETRNYLYIVITDNGRGMSGNDLIQLRHSLSDSSGSKDSIGLRNVNQRFKLLFGELFGVNIESIVDIGTEITLHMPKETEEDCNNV